MFRMLEEKLRNLRVLRGKRSEMSHDEIFNAECLYDQAHTGIVIQMQVKVY